MGIRSTENQPVLDLASMFYNKYLNIIQPAVKYILLRVNGIAEEQKQVFLENNIILSGKGIYNLLKHCDTAVIYCLTLGNKLDEAISDLQENEFYEAFILDSIASALTNGLQELLTERIFAEAKELNKKLTKRFSPGYSGWELQEQKHLFSILDPEDIGIKLSENYFMLPRKSVSGIFGFYR